MFIYPTSFYQGDSGREAEGTNVTFVQRFGRHNSRSTAVFNFSDHIPIARRVRGDRQARSRPVVRRALGWVWEGRFWRRHSDTRLRLGAASRRDRPSQSIVCQLASAARADCANLVSVRRFGVYARSRRRQFATCIRHTEVGWRSAIGGRNPTNTHAPGNSRPPNRD